MDAVLMAVAHMYPKSRLIDPDASQIALDKVLPWLAMSARHGWLLSRRLSGIFTPRLICFCRGSPMARESPSLPDMAGCDFGGCWVPFRLLGTQLG